MSEFSSFEAVFLNSAGPSQQVTADQGTEMPQNQENGAVKAGQGLQDQEANAVKAVQATEITQKVENGELQTPNLENGMEKVFQEPEVPQIGENITLQSSPCQEDGTNEVDGHKITHDVENVMPQTQTEPVEADNTTAVPVDYTNDLRLQSYSYYEQLCRLHDVGQVGDLELYFSDIRVESYYSFVTR